MALSRGRLLAAKLAWEAWKAYLGLDKLEVQRRRFANEGPSSFDEVDLTTSDAA